MSAVTSDISRKFNSRIFLTTLGGRDAVGLKGPGAWSLGAVPVTGVAAGIGAIGVGGLDDRAADASMSTLLTAAGSGEKSGSEARADGGGSEPKAEGGSSEPEPEADSVGSEPSAREYGGSEPRPTVNKGYLTCLMRDFPNMSYFSSPCCIDPTAHRPLILFRPLADARGRLSNPTPTPPHPSPRTHDVGGAMWRVLKMVYLAQPY